MLPCASWRSPHRRAQTSCVRFLCAAMHRSVAHEQSAQTATVPLYGGERKFTSLHGTVCFTCLPAPVPMLFDHVCTMAFLACRSFREHICAPSSYDTVEPLSWQGALRVSARQVIHLHPEFIDCSECEQHLPFALQVLLKERIFPSTYIPTQE